MKTIYHNLAAALCLMCCAACAGDPLTGGSDIPDADGVPFTFTAAPPPAITTRAVPGNDQWKGDGTEKIRVAMARDGIIPVSGTYTVISPEGKTEVRPGDQPILWPSAVGSYNVSAWYPALEPGVEHNVSNQSTPEKFRQADVLWAEKWGVPYNTTPVLEFSRQMAKVRVVLTGVDPSAADTEVGIKGRTRFTLTNYGEMQLVGSTDYITACRDAAGSDAVAFEALLPVNTSTILAISTEIRILTGGRTYYFTPAKVLELHPGKAYTYRVAIPSSATAARHIQLPADAVQAGDAAR